MPNKFPSHSRDNQQWRKQIGLYGAKKQEALKRSQQKISVRELPHYPMWSLFFLFLIVTAEAANQANKIAANTNHTHSHNKNLSDHLEDVPSIESEQHFINKLNTTSTQKNTSTQDNPINSTTPGHQPVHVVQVKDQIIMHGSPQSENDASPEDIAKKLQKDYKEQPFLKTLMRWWFCNGGEIDLYYEEAKTPKGYPCKGTYACTFEKSIHVRQPTTKLYHSIFTHELMHGAISKLELDPDQWKLSNQVIMDDISWIKAKLKACTMLPFDCDDAKEVATFDKLLQTYKDRVHFMIDDIQLRKEQVDKPTSAVIQALKRIEFISSFQLSVADFHTAAAQGNPMEAGKTVDGKWLQTYQLTEDILIMDVKKIEGAITKITFYFDGSLQKFEFPYRIIQSIEHFYHAPILTSLKRGNSLPITDLIAFFKEASLTIQPEATAHYWHPYAGKIREIKVENEPEFYFIYYKSQEKDRYNHAVLHLQKALRTLSSAEKDSISDTRGEQIAYLAEGLPWNIIQKICPELTGFIESKFQAHEERLEEMNCELKF